MSDIDMKMGSVLCSALDRIMGDVPSWPEAPTTARDVLAFLDSHKCYLEIPDGKGKRGCVLYEDGAFKAYTPDDKPIRHSGEDFETLEDALLAYAEWEREQLRRAA